MASADILLFAIQGAVKLGFQARAAFVDSTRNRELTLPLPNFSRSASASAAANHFRNRPAAPTDPGQLRELVRKLQQDVVLTQEEQKLLMLYHEDDVLRSLGKEQMTPASDGSRVTGASLNALVTIRQWARGGEPNPSALQRLAGTFLEIGVDYFVSMPGGLDPNSRLGKGLRAFFTGFDEIQFATEPLGDLPARMFTATMESIATNPGLLAQDPKVQELIAAATRGLAADVAARVVERRKGGAADPQGEIRIAGWAELAFRSVLSSVGKRVADDPTRYLGVSGRADAALVSGVANAAIEVVLAAPDGQLDNVFSQPALERLTEAALLVVARHPELVGKTDNHLKTLVSQIATDLAARDRLFSNQAIPEIAQSILARTAENLPLLWPDAAGNPRKHLGLTAAQVTLGILARKPKDGETWKPEFASRDLAAVTDAVLGELVQNPGWLISEAGDLSDSLGVALESMVDVLRRRGTARLSTRVAADLVKAGLRAAALRSEFVTELQNGAPIVGALLDAVLDETFKPGADAAVQWRLVKNEVMVGLFETAARKLAESDLDAAKIAIVQKVLAANVKGVKAGKAWSIEQFALDLEAAL
jgi:hypothetical protein